MTTINSEVSEISLFNINNIPSENEFAFDHRGIILKYFDYLLNKIPLPIISWV